MNDKVVWITGASSGIGEATALRFAKEGWKVAVSARRVELLNTPAGNIVKEIIKAGHTIGISSRGTGSVQATNENTLEVQPDFELVCWDFVSNPSTHGAFMNPVSLQEGKVKVSKYTNLDFIINDILRA